VIALHGKGGSDKTTAVNIVAGFNPWWFSKQKDLTRSFFSELIAPIGTSIPG